MANNAGSTGENGLSKDYVILNSTYGNFSHADNPYVDPYMDDHGISNPDQYTTVTPILADIYDADGDGDMADIEWSEDSLGYPFAEDQVACNEFNAGDCPNSP